MGSCRSMDPVGTHLTTNFAFFGTAFGQSGSSRQWGPSTCRSYILTVEFVLYLANLRLEIDASTYN